MEEGGPVTFPQDRPTALHLLKRHPLKLPSTEMQALHVNAIPQLSEVHAAV